VYHVALRSGRGPRRDVNRRMSTQAERPARSAAGVPRPKESQTAMAMTKAEFEAILRDETKIIEGDIMWSEDEDHSPAVVFRTDVQTEAGWPLFINGNHNPLIPRTSYHLIHRQVGRIYGLDHGKEHPNPDGSGRVGEKHKHQWTEEFRDTCAYVPEDITAPPDDPVAVWEQFCREAGITHRGHMNPPPGRQRELMT